MPQPDAAIAASASSSCGPQSHLSEPSTSPVRHSLWSRTSGGSPFGAPISRATCSAVSLVRAEGDDLRLLGEAGRQRARARRCARSAPVPNAIDVRRRRRRASSPAVAADEQGRQQPGAAAPARAPRARSAAQPSGAVRNGPLSGVGEVERRIGDRGRRGEVDPGLRARSAPARSARASRWLVSFSVAARLPEISRSAGRVAVEGGERRRRRRSRSARNGDVVDRHRPAAPQRVDRAGDVPRAAQSANSVTSGTWSDGRVQLRQGSWTMCAHGQRRRRPPVAHIWSSRRPRSFSGPVGRAVAPPGVEPLRRRMEMAAEIDPVVARLEPGQRLDLDRRVADDVEQLLVAPDVAFERRDVEVADHDRRAVAHASDQRVIRSMKSSFWPNLGFSVAVGNVAAGGDVDVLEPDPAVEPDADMARLAIGLPVEPVVLAHRHPAERWRRRGASAGRR